MKLGIISDTHGILHPEVPEIFKGVDRIIHAGDIVGEHVLEGLRVIAPVDAVAGNYDPDPLPGVRKDPCWLWLEGLPVFLTHRMFTFDWETTKELLADLILKYPRPPRIVIFGHTHFPVAEEIKGIYFMNPGYAGPDPLEGPYTVGLLTIDRVNISGRIITLDRSSLSPGSAGQ